MITVCKHNFWYQGHKMESRYHTDFRSHPTPNGFISLFNRSTCIFVHLECSLKKSSNCDSCVKSIETFEIPIIKIKSYLSKISFDKEKQLFILF